MTYQCSVIHIRGRSQMISSPRARGRGFPNDDAMTVDYQGKGGFANEDVIKIDNFLEIVQDFQDNFCKKDECNCEREIQLWNNFQVNFLLDLKYKVKLLIK